MELRMVWGKVLDDWQQGLTNLRVNFYPHSRENLEQELKAKAAPQEKDYSKRYWHSFVQKELKKLWEYDYDITYQHYSWKNHSHLQKYSRNITVIYNCKCDPWQQTYQKVTFFYELLSEANYLESTLQKSKQIEKKSKQSARFGRQLAKELSALLKKTIYPYLLRYEVIVDQKQCKKCGELTVPKLHKSKLTTLSRLFCRHICQLLIDETMQVQKLCQKEATIQRR